MKFHIVSMTAAAALLTMGAATAAEDSAAYANKLWSAMESKGLVGANGVMSTPYQGVHPHGAILDTIEARLKVGDNSGKVIIKRNYGGEGVSKMAVANDPAKWLKAVTVMYKRPNYDPETRDWFWVKYAADGTVLKNPAGMPLAGLVGKGASAGCIACHKSAPGGDYMFNHD